MRFFNYRRRFSSLSEQEILALAISSEEEDASIYRSFAAHLRAEYPASAAIFDGMAVEENNHRQQLTDLYVQRFGDHIPLLRREHVAGYYYRRPIWLMQNLGLDRIRAESAVMEQQAGVCWRTWRPARQRIRPLHKHSKIRILPATKPAAKTRAQNGSLSLLGCSRVWPDLWMGRCPHWRLFLPPPLPPKTAKQRFWLALRPRWGREYPWASPKRPQMMVRSRVADRRSNAVWPPG